MNRCLMTYGEILAHEKKLTKQGMKGLQLSSYTFLGKERAYNPNLATLFNPKAVEQIDLSPHCLELKVFVYHHEAPWQIHLDTTEHQALKCVLFGKHEKYLGIKVTADASKLDVTSFLGAVRFRVGEEDLIRISFWYNKILSQQ